MSILSVKQINEVLKKSDGGGYVLNPVLFAQDLHTKREVLDELEKCCTKHPDNIWTGKTNYTRYPLAKRLCPTCIKDLRIEWGIGE